MKHSNPLQELGPSSGVLESVSESLQQGICICGLVVGAGGSYGLSLLGIDVSFSVCVSTSFVLVLVAYGVSLRLPLFRRQLHCHEAGLRLVQGGKETAFRYDQLTAFERNLRHYQVKRGYPDSTVNFDFRVEGIGVPLHYDGDYKQGSAVENVIARIIDHCERAVQKRLMRQLESEGEIRWTPHVSLTLEGLRIDSPGQAPSQLDFDDIDGWKWKKNELHVYRIGDVLPCLRLPGDQPNFSIVLSLVVLIWEQYHDQPTQTAESDAVPGSAPVASVLG